MGLFKPNIERLEKNKNVRKLISALEYKADATVRKQAASALGSIRDESAISALETALLAEDDPGVRGEIALALKACGYSPDLNEAGARYAALTGDYEFCARCGPGPGIQNLCLAFIGLPGDNTSQYRKWRDAYLQCGPAGFAPLVQLFEQYYGQYKSFVSGIQGLNFALESDRKKAAIIKMFSQKICQLTQTVAQYKDARAFEFLSQAYRRVVHDIYSHSAGGFLDIFNAVDIRSSIADGMAAFDVKEYGDKVAWFLYGIFLHDECFLVRWHAVQVLDSWPLDVVRSNPLLMKGLQFALEKVPTAPEHSATSGYQKSTIRRIMGGH